MSYSTDRFLQHLYQQTLPAEKLANCTDDRFTSLLREKRADFRRVLRIDDWYAMSNPKIKKIKSEPWESHTLIQYDLELLPELIVPLWVLEPKDANGRNLLYCHGHDQYGARGSFTRFEENAYHKFLPLCMAEEGYCVVIPELIGFGDSKLESFREEESRGCYANSTNLLTMGYNMAGLRVFEAMTVLDIMINRWEMELISVHGISGGGLVASYLAALDQRMDAVIVAGYTNSFKETILPLFHCIDNHTPGILAVGECAELIALAAPTPLLVSSGTEDPIFPVAGTKAAFDEISQIYKRLNAEDQAVCEIFEGEHETSFVRMIPFLNEIYQA